MAALRSSPEKFCVLKRCRRLLVRRRAPSGRLESFDEFVERKYCNSECKGNAYRRADSARHCEQCSARLVRRRKPCGALETREQFRHRRWCHAHCRDLWLAEDHTRKVNGGAKHSRAIKRSPKYRTWLRGRRRSNPKVCFHGRINGSACVFCERLRRDARCSTRMLVRRRTGREGWERLGLWLRIEENMPWAATA